MGPDWAKARNFLVIIYMTSGELEININWDLYGPQILFMVLFLDPHTIADGDISIVRSCFGFVWFAVVYTINKK